MTGPLSDYFGILETLLMELLDSLYASATGVANGQAKVAHVRPCPIHLLIAQRRKINTASNRTCRPWQYIKERHSLLDMNFAV